MILLSKFRPFALHNAKYMTLTLPRTQTLQLVHQFEAAALQPQKADVIANLSEKLCCNEYVAKNIYNEFPLLRSVDVINNNSLELLRSQVSAQSIIENPSLITMNTGNVFQEYLKFTKIDFVFSTFLDILKEKINLLKSIKPRKLDDFAPLLALDQKELKRLVARFLKDENEIERGNRIYFLSEKLKVIEWSHIEHVRE